MPRAAARRTHAAHRCMFDTFKGEMGAEWARGKLNSACVRREDSFGARVTGKLASNACAKPATTCKQLHEMSVAVSLVGDVDA